VEVLAHKHVVVEVRVGGTNTVDFLHLTRREVLPRVKAPAALHEALPPQDLVNAGDTTRELMLRIKEGGVGVSNLSVQRQPLRSDRFSSGD
jgi:hypothetical protein